MFRFKAKRVRFAFVLHVLVENFSSIFPLLFVSNILLFSSFRFSIFLFASVFFVPFRFRIFVTLQFAYFRFVSFALLLSFRFVSLFASFRFISFSFRMRNLLFSFKAKQAKQTPRFRFEAKRISLPFRLVSLRMENELSTLRRGNSFYIIQRRRHVVFPS